MRDGVKKEGNWEVSISEENKNTPQSVDNYTY